MQLRTLPAQECSTKTYARPRRQKAEASLHKGTPAANHVNTAGRSTSYPPLSPPTRATTNHQRTLHTARQSDKVTNFQHISDGSIHSRRSAQLTHQASVATNTHRGRGRTAGRQQQPPATPNASNRHKHQSRIGSINTADNDDRGNGGYNDDDVVVAGKWPANFSPTNERTNDFVRSRSRIRHPQSESTRRPILQSINPS